MSVFFDASPWALPLTGIALVLILPICRPVGRWLGCRPVVAWLWLGSLAGYMAVTTTPSLSPGGARGRALSLEFHPISLRDLAGLNAEALNVWLTVPMGFVTAWIVCRTARKVALMLIPFVLPMGAEMWQYAVPALGRSAFILDDVAANEVGVVLGSLAAVIVCLALRVLVPRRPAEEPGAQINDSCRAG